MNKPIKYEALPDELIEGEDTVSADTLFNDIMAGFAELQAFAEGKTLRVTEYVEGTRLPSADVTAAELKARQVARNANATSPQNGFMPDMNGEARNEQATAGQNPLVAEVLPSP